MHSILEALKLLYLIYCMILQHLRCRHSLQSECRKFVMQQGCEVTFVKLSKSFVCKTNLDKRAAGNSKTDLYSPQ